jgi:hypothetical protein
MISLGSVLPVTRMRYAIPVFTQDNHRYGDLGGFAKEGLNRLRKNPWDCHPEEPQAVLSEAKEGSPWFVETTTAGILRFAQNDRLEAFFRSLSSAGSPSAKAESPLVSRITAGPRVQFVQIRVRSAG